MPIEKTYTDSPFTSEVHCPAAVTPFDKDGDLMVDEFKEVLRFHLDVNRVDAFLIAGDNGEGYTLSADELARVTRAAAEEIGKRVPFYVHVTRTSNTESLQRARAAAEAGAYGICLMPQTYIHKATAAEIVADIVNDNASAKAHPTIIFCPRRFIRPRLGVPVVSEWSRRIHWRP